MRNDKNKNAIDNGLAAKVRKLEEKLEALVKVLEAMFGIDLDKDGKVGGIRVALLAALATVCLVASVYAANQARWTLRNEADTSDIAEIDEEGDMTIAGTMTATGGFSGAISGDPTADDFNMSGSVSNTLGFNVTKAASVTGLAATVIMDIGGLAIDTDYVQDVKLRMNNDATQSVDWVYWNYIIDDNTDGTEDGTAELYMIINGSATKVMDFTAGVASFPVGASISAANLTAGTTASAINGASITNLAGGNIASGNIDVARISEALKAPGAIGGTTPAAGAFTTVAASGAITANGGITIVSGAYTGVLNVVSTTLTFVVNGATTNVLDADITTAE